VGDDLGAIDQRFDKLETGYQTVVAG